MQSQSATEICGNSSVGRARPCQGRGREFESRFPLQEVISNDDLFFCAQLARRPRTRGPDSPEGKSAKPTGGKILIALLAPPYPQLKNPCRWPGSSFPAQKLPFCVWIAPAESISCTKSRYLCTERKFDCNPCTFSWFLCRKLVLSVQPCTNNQFLCRLGLRRRFSAQVCAFCPVGAARACFWYGILASVPVRASAGHPRPRFPC